MRKYTALTMVALLALTLAVAVMSCAQKAQESSTSGSTTPAETAMPDTAAMADTSMHH